MAALPSAWTDWSTQATTWIEGTTAPSDWTDWAQSRTWTESNQIPSGWTDWVEAETARTISAGHRLTGSGWVQLGTTARRTPGGWALVELGSTTTQPGPDPDPSGVWWSHYDQQVRAGAPSDSNPAFTSFEWAMKSRMSNPPAEPVGTFIHGYSGSNFPATFQSSAVASAPSMGVGAMLNVKRSDWAGLASGAYDSTITSFFNSWPTGTFGSFTINHEPENDGPSPANPSNSAYATWAATNGPIWCEGIARTIAVAAPIIRARGLDVKLGGCLMDFSWDTTRWQWWDWWNYVDPDDMDVVEFQIDAYAKTDIGPPTKGHNLIPRIMECYQHALDVGIEHLSIFETAVDRRQRNGGDNMVGTDETVAAWWETYGPAIEAIPGARMVNYFSIPTGPASGQAAIMGRGLDVFANICLNGRRP